MMELTHLTRDYEERLKLTDNSELVYQKELMLYCCLMMQRMGCESFSATHEVKRKFDNVICKFNYEGTNYCTFCVTSRTSNKARTYTRSQSTSNEWKPLIVKYFIEILKTNAQFPKPSYQKFFLLINTELNNDSDFTVSENDDVFTHFFKSFGERRAKVKKCKFEYIQKILYSLSSKGYKIEQTNAKDLEENFRIITETPEISDLTILNNEFLERIFPDTKNIVKYLRGKFNNFFLSHKSKTQESLDIQIFEHILMNSFLDTEIPMLQKKIFENFPFAIEFSNGALTRMSKKLPKTSATLYCEDNARIYALKVFNSLKLKDKNVALITFSDLKKSHLEALNYYDRKLVIFVDKSTILREDIKINENITFVRKLTGKENLATPLFELSTITCDDFTQMTIEQILNTKIYIQSSNIYIRDIPEFELKNTFLLNLYLKTLSKMPIKLGKQLPATKIPSFYIERRFFWEEYGASLKEKELFADFQLSIIKGDSGIGKSTTLLKMANDFKSTNPYYWIEYFELGQLSENLNVGLHSISDELSSDDAKDFLLDHLISYGSNKSLDRELLKYYLSIDKEKVPILLIFDAFEKPNSTVTNLIEKLLLLKINICIGVPLHCNFIKQRIPVSHCEVVMQAFDDQQQELFLKTFFEEHEKSSENLLPSPAKKSKKIKIEKNSTELLKDFKDVFENLKIIDEKFLKTPFLLQIMAEIFLEECLTSNNVGQHFHNIDPLILYKKTIETTFNIIQLEKDIDSGFQSDRVRKSYTQVSTNKLLFSCPENIDEYKTAEISYKTRANSANTDLMKVHQHYSEYFTAGTMLFDLENRNDDATIKRLNEMKADSKTIRFVYQMLIAKIQQDNLKVFSKHTLNKNCDFLHFLNGFFEYIWNIDFSNLPSILNNLRKIKVEDFSTSSTPNDKKVLSDCVDKWHKIFWSKIILSDDIRFVKDFHKNLLKYGILEHDFLQDIFTHLKLVGKEKFLKDNIFFWYIEMKYKISNDLFEDLKNQRDPRQNQIFKNIKFYVQYILHLYQFARKKEIHDTFLSEFCCKVLDKDNRDEIYNFISSFEDYEIGREILFDRFVDILQEQGYDFMVSENQSMMYRFWNFKQKELFREFLNIFSKEDIKKFTQKPNFRGKSLLEYYHSDCNYITFDFYILYVYDIFGEKEVLKYFSKYKKNENIVQSFKKDFTICCYLAKTREDNPEIKVFLDKVINLFCKRAFDLEKAQKFRINFLEYIEEMRIDGSSEFVYNQVSKRMENKKKLLEND